MTICPNCRNELYSPQCRQVCGVDAGPIRMEFHPSHPSLAPPAASSAQMGRISSPRPVRPMQMGSPPPRRHHDDPQSLIFCDDCGFSSTSMGAFERHRCMDASSAQSSRSFSSSPRPVRPMQMGSPPPRRHHDDPQSLIFCDDCGFSSTSMRAFERHKCMDASSAQSSRSFSSSSGTVMPMSMGSHPASSAAPAAQHSFNPSPPPPAAAAGSGDAAQVRHVSNPFAVEVQPQQLIAAGFKRSYFIVGGYVWVRVGSMETPAKKVSWPGLKKVRTVGLGFEHDLFVTNFGKVLLRRFQYAEWSSNMVGGVKDIVAVSTEGDSHFAVDERGRVWAWGTCNCGQLGIGRRVDKVVTPVWVRNLPEIAYVVAVPYSSLFLSTAGAVFECGIVSSGILLNPVEIQGLEKIKAIGIGNLHRFFLTEETGQLLQQKRSRLFSREPILFVPGLKKGIVAFAVGGDHCLAVDEGRRVWAWGMGNFGQLGTGQAGPDYMEERPKIIPKLYDVVAVAASACYSIAVTSKGEVFHWGCGNLETGEISFELEPVLIPGLPRLFLPKSPLQTGLSECRSSETYTNVEIITDEKQCPHCRKWILNFLQQCSECRRPV